MKRVWIGVFSLLWIGAISSLSRGEDLKLEPSNGLVGYWRFDEGSGDVLRDSSGCDNHGTLINGQWVSTDAGPALKFDGEDDYVTIPVSESLKITDEITIEALVKPIVRLEERHSVIHGWPAYGLWTDFGMHHWRAYVLLPEEEGKQKWEDNKWMDGGTVDLDIFQHVTFTYSSKNGDYIIYKNGELANSKKIPGNLKIKPIHSFIHIGALSKAKMFFPGIIAEIRLYNRALSVEEIKKHFLEKAKILGIAPGKLMLQMGHNDRVTAIAFSKDDKNIISWSEWEKLAKIWDISTGSLIQTIPQKQPEEYWWDLNPQFSKVDDFIVRFPGWKQEINFIRKNEAFTINMPPKHEGRYVVFIARISPDKKLLAAGCGGLAYVWNTDSLQLKYEFRHSHIVTCLDFSPDSSILAVSGRGETIDLWDLNTGKKTRRLQGHSRKRSGWTWVMYIKFSPDGKMLASAGLEPRVRLWDVETGREIAALDTTQIWERAGEQTVVLHFSFSRDGRFLACTAGNGIGIWDLSDYKLHRGFKKQANVITQTAFSLDNNYLGISDSNGRIYLLRVPSCQILRIKAEDTAVNSIDFSNSGNTLASGTDSGTIKLYSIPELRLIKSTIADEEPITAVKFLKNDKILASSSFAGNIGFWDSDSFENIRTVKPQSKSIFNNFILSMDVSPDNRFIAWGGYDKEIILWNIKQNRIQKVLKGNNGWITSLRFSPDAKFLASGTMGGNLTLWDVDGETLANNTGIKRADIHALAFSPVSKILISQSSVSGFRNESITFLRLPDLENIQEYSFHEGLITSISYSSDGKYLATGSRDSTIKIFEIEQDRIKKLLLTLFLPKEDAYVMFTPEKNYRSENGAEKYLKLIWNKKVIAMEELAKDFGYENKPKEVLIR